MGLGCAEETRWLAIQFKRGSDPVSDRVSMHDQSHILHLLFPMHFRKHLLTVLLATASAASLQAGDNEAGSLLLYPDWVLGSGEISFLTVTNTNATEDVAVEFIYIDAETCLEFNRTTELTPLDTYTAVSFYHNPSHGSGYVYALAKDSVTGEPISFNYLVGDMEVIVGFTVQANYAMNPYSFQGVGADGSLTDINGNGMRDMDGTEYSMVPDEIIVPRFWADTGFDKQARSTGLTLIALSGGSQFSTTVDFLIFNDNEQAFSSEYTFYCHAKVLLPDVSYLFTRDFLHNHTDDDPDEVHGFHNSTGWFILDGAVANSQSTSIPDPAVLAHVTHARTLYDQGEGSRGKGVESLSWSSQLPFHRGEQSNGSLLAHTQSGN